MYLSILICSLFLLFNLSLFAGEITVTDTDIPAGATVYWTADNTYILDGRVFVDEGAVLHIEAGTVIMGKPGQGENASVLIIARGAKIYAEGSAENPIIFTVEGDDVTDPDDLPFDQKGLWGGVIILGKATINVAAGENDIEGIPTTEARGLYGGTNDDDTSGILRYVSIRHGGTEIGEGNEINGLTLGGVGRGTIIDHVEVYANKDDGFEWFGGTVSSKYLISAFCGDDAFDMDEGFRGKNQFIFALQHPDYGNRCAEHDGAPKSNVTAEPKAYAVTYNATFLGSGKESTNADQDYLLRLRENWGGEYNNSIFGDYNGYGIKIDDTYSPNDSKNRLAAGEIVFNNNIWFDIDGYHLSDSVSTRDYIQSYLQDAANGNTEEDPQLGGISRTQDGLLDPRPDAGGPAYQNLKSYPNDGFFEAVDFKGAFGQTNWAEGWTALSHYGALTTAIVETEYRSEIAASFELSQNFPNPFNPFTTIQFRLPKAAQVKLSIYNTRGQEVAVLINDFRQAGSYSLKWNAENLSSGMYVYRLESGNRVVSRKMLLIK